MSEPENKDLIEVSFKHSEEFFSYTFEFKVEDGRQVVLFERLCKDFGISMSDSPYYEIVSINTVQIFHVPESFNYNDLNKDNEIDFIGKVFYPALLEKIKYHNDNTTQGVLVHGSFEEYIYKELCNMVMRKHGLSDNYLVTSTNFLFSVTINVTGNRLAVEEINETWDRLFNLKAFKRQVDTFVKERISLIMKEDNR